MTRRIGALVLGGLLLATPLAAQGARTGANGAEPLSPSVVQPVGVQVAAPGAAVPADATAAAQVLPATGSAPAADAAPGLSRFGPAAAGAVLLAPARIQAQQPRLAHAPAYRRGTPGVALMIVGGALFVAGAIIDDRAGDAVMVGGVVVAAIGLYQYLQ